MDDLLLRSSTMKISRAFLLAVAVVLAVAAVSYAGEPTPPATVKVEFKESTVVDALRLLSEISGLNIVPTAEAGGRTVTLYLRDVSPRVAVDTLCKVAGLWHRADKETGVIRVMTTKEYQKDLVIFRDDNVEVFTLLHPNTLAIARSIADLFGPRVVLSLGLNNIYDEDDTNDDDPDDDYDRTGRYSRSGRATTSRRRTGATLDPGVELTPEQIERVEKARAAGQKELPDELRARQREERPIYITVHRQHNLLMVRTDDKQALEQIRKLIARVDRPIPQVLLEVKILQLDLTDGFRSVFDLQYSDGTSSFGIGNYAAAGGTFIYEQLNNRIQARIELMQSENRVNVLGTPLILCANDGEAEIFVGEERPITRNFQLQTNTTEGVVTERIVPSVELQDIGTRLSVRPQINADRTVTITVTQDVSNVVVDGAQIPVPLNNGQISEVDVDTVTTANAKATIMGKDGLTVALGGLIRDEISDSKEKVPLLGDLPLIGFFFRRDVTARTKKELVLLITPHVLMTPTEGVERTKERMKALSIHPYHEEGDGSVHTFDKDDVPAKCTKRPWVDNVLKPFPNE
jgi:general secretion pathway protein D